MPEPRIIAASPDGMRVLVDEKRCELQEYDFAANRWLRKDGDAWPLTRARADAWLVGWKMWIGLRP